MAARNGRCVCETAEKMKQLVDTGTFSQLSEMVKEVKAIGPRIATLESLAATLGDAVRELTEGNNKLTSIIVGVGKSKGLDETVRDMDDFFKKLKPIYWLLLIILGLIGTTGIWRVLQFILTGR